MAEPRTLPPRRVTVVHAPGCHFCDDAEVALGDLAREFALDVRLLAVGDPRGAALVAEHHAPMFPLVLVDDAFFSAGRLPRGKLRRLLGTVPFPAAGAL